MLRNPFRATWKPWLKPYRLLAFTAESSFQGMSKQKVRNGFRPSTKYWPVNQRAARGLESSIGQILVDQFSSVHGITFAWETTNHVGNVTHGQDWGREYRSSPNWGVEVKDRIRTAFLLVR